MKYWHSIPMTLFLSFSSFLQYTMIPPIIRTAKKLCQYASIDMMSTNYLVKKMSLLSYIFMMTKANGSKSLTAHLYKEHVLYKSRELTAQEMQTTHSREKELV